MLSDVEAVVREITAGLNELHAEGSQTQAQLQRWTEVARKAKELLPQQATAETAPPPVVPPREDRPARSTRPTATAAAATMCALCGSAMKAGAKFCSKCGTIAQRAPEAAVAPRACVVCGGALRPEARFCRSCGTAANHSSQQPLPPLPPPSAPVWRATNMVPPTGMAAWGIPDGVAPPLAQLAAGTELELVSQRGAWAEVRASNGWIGWVDSRLLLSR